MPELFNNIGVLELNKHSKSGNLQKALGYFEKALQIANEQFEINQDNVKK